MKLELLTNATTADDAIGLVSQRSTDKTVRNPALNDRPSKGFVKMYINLQYLHSC
jgi:hypothetical protein